MHLLGVREPEAGSREKWTGEFFKSGSSPETTFASALKIGLHTPILMSGNKIPLPPALRACWQARALENFGIPILKLRRRMTLLKLQEHTHVLMSRYGLVEGFGLGRTWMIVSLCGDWMAEAH